MSMLCARVASRWAVLCLTLGFSASAAEYVQRIDLRAGWNAVWLEVTPADPSPGAVFAGSPVDAAAVFHPSVTTVQFVTDPGEEPWKRPGWAVWYAPARAEAALSTLSVLSGGQACLVHALQAGTLAVRGEAHAQPLRWFANGLNFVGLPADPEEPPTFAQFFAGAAAHQPLRVYHLLDGRWRLVSSPATTAIRRGVAYWIYSAGRSDWQGPLSVLAGAGGGIDFGDAAEVATVALSNRGAQDATVSIRRLGGNLPLQMHQGTRSGNLAAQPLVEVLDAGTVRSGSAVTLSLTVRRDGMASIEDEALLEVRGAGCLKLVPVKAARGAP